MRIIFPVLVCVASACAHAPPSMDRIRRDPASTQQVGELLDGWHRAAANADFEGYFGCFAEGGVFLGTDATEHWSVDAFRQYAQPHFAEGDAWSFRAVRREVWFSHDLQTAWFDEDLATEGLGPARGSGVVVRTPDGAWRIAHYNLALTVPNERFEAVRAVLSGPVP